jgi:hypothetical protein
MNPPYLIVVVPSAVALALVGVVGAIWRVKTKRRRPRA